MIVFLLQSFFATFFAYILSWMFGALTPTIAVVSLVLGYFIARRRAVMLKRAFPDLRFGAFNRGESGAIEVIATCLVLYVSTRHFLWMFFELDTKLMTLHANNFGDLPMHINYIRSIANGLAFPPVNPSFASEALRYPFGPDLYNALWEILGVPMSSHLFVVGLLSTIVSLTVLRWFGSWWAVGAFFLSGGIGGWQILIGQPLPVDLLAGIDWKNLFLAVFITQRGVLFALPAGILLIEATRRSFFGEARLSKNVATTLGLLWGILPLFHAHAFVIVSLIMGFTAMNARGGFKGLWELLWSRSAKVAYLPAIYFILRTSDGFKKSSIIHWDPWWTSTMSEAPGFMLQNFGAWLLLPPALFIAIYFAKRRAWMNELAIYLGLFVVFFNVMLAPWAWDNIKILIFPYLGFARLAWVTLDQKLPSFAKYIVAFVLFLSGFLALQLSFAPPGARALTIYSTSSLGLVESALKDVPMGAVFAAAPTHDHPLTYFGRLRAVGYEGHLWSHGIDYVPKMNALKQLMKAAPNSDVTRLAHELGATHIFWGPAETGVFGPEPTWPVSFKNVSRTPGVDIYEVPQK